MKRIATAAVKKNGKYTPAPLPDSSDGSDMVLDWEEIISKAKSVKKIQNISGWGSYTAVYEADGVLYLVSSKSKIELSCPDDDDDDFDTGKEIDERKRHLSIKGQELITLDLILATSQAIAIYELESNKNITPFVVMANIKERKPIHYKLDYGSPKELEAEYRKIKTMAKKNNSHCLVFLSCVDSKYLVTQALHDGTCNGRVLPYKVQGTKIVFGKEIWGLKGSGIKSWPMPNLLK